MTYTVIHHSSKHTARDITLATGQSLDEALDWAKRLNRKRVDTDVVAEDGVVVARFRCKRQSRFRDGRAAA